MTTPKATEWIAEATFIRESPAVDCHQIGVKMREIRKKSGIGIREMARRIGLTAPFLYDCEKGFRKLKPEKLQEFINQCAEEEQKKEAA